MKALILAAALLAAAANADVLDSQPNGFALRETVHVKAPPEKVFDALLHPAQWWNPQHTFGQNAAGLSLDARAGGCLCESLPHGAAVLHATVVYVAPPNALVLRGPLGPFQGQGVDSAITFTLKAEPGGTVLTLDNSIGGYVKGGFDKWPERADAMLTDLVTRLKTYTETGKPD